MQDLEQVKAKIDITDYIKSTFGDLGKATKSKKGTLYKNCPVCR